MSETYKGFTLNTPGSAAPWGPTERTALQNIIATLVMGCCAETIDTTGHKHYKLHYSDGSGIALSVDADGDVTVGDGLAIKAGGSAGLRLEDDGGNGITIADGGELRIDLGKNVRWGVASYGFATLYNNLWLKVRVNIGYGDFTAYIPITTDAPSAG